MRFAAICVLAVTSVSNPFAAAQNFTLDQALSAPYASDLVASQESGSFAWVENEQGKRNVWIATPNGSGGFTSRRLTSYDQDDGQEIDEVAWTPDGTHVVYGRGGDFEFPGRSDPNPALNSEGVSQNIYVVAATI